MNWTQRFVVFDCETTGVDPEKDYLVSIGAIVVENREICLEETFETLVQVPYNSPSVVLHGITREETLAGLEEAEAVRQFLVFAGDAPLVGHHVGFDLQVIQRIAGKRLKRSVLNPAMDLMELTMELGKKGAFGQAEEFSRFDLDGLCERFRIEPHDRHTAVGDAFLTAQIFLKLLKAGQRTGVPLPTLARPE